MLDTWSSYLHLDSLSNREHDQGEGIRRQRYLGNKYIRSKIILYSTRQQKINTIINMQVLPGMTMAPTVISQTACNICQFSKRHLLLKIIKNKMILLNFELLIQKCLLCSLKTLIFIWWRCRANIPGRAYGIRALRFSSFQS